MAKKNTTEAQTVIEINGRRYDARSGQQLNGHRRLVNDVAPPHAGASLSPRRTSARLPHVAHHSKARTAPSPLKHHQTQSATTLMRASVHKPVPMAKQRLTAHTPTDILAKHPRDVVVAPKLSVTQVSPTREARAKRTPLNQQVHRFLGPTPASSTKPTQRLTPEALAHVSVRTQPQRSPDIFDRALARADAHTEPAVHPRAHSQPSRRRPLHRRTSSLVIASLVILLLCGFLAYQNKATITLRYANAQAGFHASLPSYRPTGFAIGRFSYKMGTISMSFDNKAAHQSFTLRQQPSNWDNQTLLNNVVTSTDQTYQALQRGNQTVYVYDNNDATWVTHGVLYQLSANGNLTTSQVLDLAGSITS